MSASRKAAPPHSLQALGIEADEERVYRALLGCGMSTARTLAAQLNYSQRRTERLLRAVEARTLATRTAESPPSYIAAPPEVAIDALIAQRNADLAKIRSAIPELQQVARSAPRFDIREPFVELIADRAAAARIFHQITEAAKTSLYCMQRLPRILSDLSDMESHVATTTAIIARGVSVRTISDTDFLSDAVCLELVRRDVEVGEQARALPSIPFKLVLVDRSVGLMPLDPYHPGGGPTLLVRESALLDALCELFDSFWTRATPLAFARSGAPKVSRTMRHLGETSNELVSLLATGLSDKVIADHLQVSPATLNRRLAELARKLDTRTRFQMGWKAAFESFGAVTDANTAARVRR